MQRQSTQPLPPFMHSRLKGDTFDSNDSSLSSGETSKTAKKSRGDDDLTSHSMSTIIDVSRGIVHETKRCYNLLERSTDNQKQAIGVLERGNHQLKDGIENSNRELGQSSYQLERAVDAIEKSNN